MSDIEPNSWNLDVSYFRLELADLKKGVRRVIEHQDAHFPMLINAASWRLATADGTKSGKVELSEVDGLFDAIDGSTSYFHLQLYHREATSNLALEKIPTIYLQFTVDFARRRFHTEVATVGLANANALMALLADDLGLVNLDLPKEHHYLEPYVGNLLKDYPDHTRNVFLIMRFQNQKPFPEIVSTIRDAFSTRRLSVLRADDKAYTDDLWDNAYMYGCSSAIAVFDEINSREFHPNVALEVGFMFSQRKPVLLLKDTAITALPTDIVGKIYRPFNTYDPISTIPPQIEKWLVDNSLGQGGAA